MPLSRGYKKHKIGQEAERDLKKRKPISPTPKSQPPVHNYAKWPLKSTLSDICSATLAQKVEVFDCHYANSSTQNKAIENYALSIVPLKRNPSRTFRYIHQTSTSSNQPWVNGLAIRTRFTPLLRSMPKLFPVCDYWIILILRIW